MQSQSHEIKKLKEAFSKYDTASRGYLSSEQYSAFAENLIASHKRGEEMKYVLDDRIEKGGKITFSDIMRADYLVLLLQPEENMVAPSTKIITLFKELNNFKELSAEDRQRIDWGLKIILRRNLFQTELEDVDDMAPEEGKAQIIPWMTNFSTPSLNPSIIEKHKRTKQYVKVSFSYLKPKMLDYLNEHLISEPISIALDSELYAGLDSLDFSIFEYEKKVGRKNVLPLVAYFVLNKNNGFSYIDEGAFRNFILKIRNGYKESNPYHNYIHVADILQVCNFMLQNGVRETAKLDGLDVTALLVSAIIHDFKHPGVNNAYLTNTGNDLALLYNDQSVLENYHVSEAYKIIWKDKDCDIFKNLTEDQKKIMRKRVTGCILGTDNAKHFEHVNVLQGMIKGLEISKGKNSEKIINMSSHITEFESKQHILTICMHAADISNPTRPYKIAKEWGVRVAEEFCQQGDLEKSKGLPISPFCDRETMDLPKFQLGFINGIVRSYFEMLVEIFPDLQPMVDNVNKSCQEWLTSSKS